MTRARWKHALALVCVVSLGALSRLHETGFHLIDKSLGDVLYGTAAYFSFGLVFARWTVARVALLAVAACWTIEIFQATGIPARHADWAFVRWFIGTTFSWHDMACYPIGVALAAMLHGESVHRGSKTKV